MVFGCISVSGVGHLFKLMEYRCTVQFHRESICLETAFQYDAASSETLGVPLCVFLSVMDWPPMSSAV